jgi:hypothetical protein
MTTSKQLRGFACMTLERRQQIASMGGKAAHQQGTAHQWTSEEAREAAKKSQKSQKRLFGMK